MKKVLVVIDMQNDFIDGSLGTKERRPCCRAWWRSWHVSARQR